MQLKSCLQKFVLCRKRTQLFPLSLGISLSCHLQLSEMPSSNFCAGSIDTTPSAESGPTLFTFDFIMHGQHRQCQCQWYIVPATTNELISCLPANITLKNSAKTSHCYREKHNVSKTKDQGRPWHSITTVTRIYLPFTRIFYERWWETRSF